MMRLLNSGTWLTAAGGWLAGDTLVVAAAMSVGVMLWPWGRQQAARLLGTCWRSGVRLGKWLAKRRMVPSTNHGSARWLTELEADKAGMLSSDGLIIGKSGKRLLRHPSKEANMVVFAPQGAGKGVGIVIPNLLCHRGSVICIDPKGENFAVTAGERLRHGPVFLISMAASGPSHHFNPMDVIAIGSGNEAAQAARLAELIMPHEATSEGHWRTKAVQWATGLIAHVAERFANEPEFRNLAMVHQYLMLPPASFARLIEAMNRSPLAVVRETAAEIERTMATHEGPGILSNMSKGTRVFSKARRAGVLCSRSDFSLADLVGPRPASLYLQVPLGEMAEYAPWIRVMVGLTVHASMAVDVVPTERPLFVIDEAATLGEVKELQDTVGQGRAYHQKIFVYQDRAQLKRSNKDWESVLANCQIHTDFAVNDLATAETVSRRLGDQTVATRSLGVSSGVDTVLAHHHNMGHGEHGRRLLQPNELFSLDADRAVVTVQGLKAPILATRIRYYQEATFAGRFGTWRGAGLCAAHTAVFPTLLLASTAGELGSAFLGSSAPLPVNQAMPGTAHIS
jgi:type IV secretion system protein VirD4